jgi:quercetin dioxygenase-like cupin family protein
MKHGLPVVVDANRGEHISVLGNRVEIRLNCADTGGAAFVFENTIPVGDGVPPHVHEREDEIVQILEGELEVFVDGKTLRASAGAIVNFPRLVAHGFRNVSNAPVRSLFIVTPGENFESFFRELSAIAPTMPADMEAVAEVFRRYGLPIVEAVPAVA